MRLRQLVADAEQVRHGLRDFPLIRIRIHSPKGEPPDLYQLTYFVRGLMRRPASVPVVREEHLVEIQLTPEYPYSPEPHKGRRPV